MKLPKGIRFSLILPVFLASTLVQAADYEEISYDDLVNRINKQKNSVVRNANDPLDDIQIHAGLGLLTSANNVNTGGGADTIKYQNGFQLSLGIDLFSPQWAAEAALRNYGQARSGTETRSLREFDLKFMHRDRLSTGSGYRLGAGLGTRYLKIEDQGTSINDTTPTAILFGGLDIYAAKNFSVGMEAGLRSAMITNSADKGAVDFTLRLDTYF